MNYNFRQAKKNDKAFILNTNKKINMVSGLNDSMFEKNIDKELLEGSTIRNFRIVQK